MIDFFQRIDVSTLIVVLIIGNFTSLALVLTYGFTNKTNLDYNIRKYYPLSKFLQSVGYILIIQRYQISDLLSVNLGNSFSFIGFYYEACAMLTVVNEEHPSLKMPRIFLGVSLVLFNGMEFIYPDPSVRVALASFCLFSLLITPCVVLLSSKGLSVFKKSVGAWYCLLVLLFPPRGYITLINRGDIFTNSLFQTLMFLHMIMLLVFSLPAYLLLMKENADKIVEHMSQTDYMTELYNRRSFMIKSMKIFEQNKADGKSISILFVDIDRFKEINDTYGHAFGDQVIVDLADHIRKNIRDGDLSCRYGGEEFVILIQENGSFTGKMVADRIHEVVRQANAFDAEKSGFRYTVSIGIVEGVPAPEDTLEVFINKADRAMYRAKNFGRDRVVEYQEEDKSPCQQLG